MHSAAAHAAALQADSLQCVAGLQSAPAPDREAIIIIITAHWRVWDSLPAFSHSSSSRDSAGAGLGPCGRNNILYHFTSDADFFTSWIITLHDIFWMSFYIP